MSRGLMRRLSAGRQVPATINGPSEPIMQAGRARRSYSRHLARLLVAPVTVLGLTVITGSAAGAQQPGFQRQTQPEFPIGACPPNSPSIVGFAFPDEYTVTSSGAVYTYQGPGQGMNGTALAAPIVGIAPAPSFAGIQSYWLVASDGGVFAFGVAQFYGSMGGQHLNSPVVGMASTADGKGYWFVAADGGVFAFGDASFYGSMGGQHLDSPVVGMASTADGNGYWFVAADGGVFAFGDASFYGSMAGQRLNAPVVGIALTGAGYYLAGADGGIFNFGDAQFWGSAAGYLSSPVIGISTVGEISDPIDPAIDFPFLATASGELVSFG